MSDNKKDKDILIPDEQYQISSRKWRPQTFDDVVGQEVIKKELKNGLERGQIANAYLFSGPRGVGKTSMARIFSKALNCEEGPPPYICNKCSQCVSITKGACMDVIEIDGASYTKVENIRDLQEGVSRTPYSAKYKIYIIDEVHMLSTSSFNALLKTLEEPPRHVVFIFATTNPEKIPETVLSRCRHYEFKRIETSDIVKRLDLIVSNEKNITISPEEKKKILEAIAISAEGGMRDAQVTLDQLLTLSEEKITVSDVEQLLGLVETEMFFDIIYGIIRKETKNLIQIVNQVVQRGRDIERLVKTFVQFIRDILILRSGGDHSLVSLYGENLNRAKKLASDISYPFLLNLLNQFFILEEKLKTTNIPSRFLLEFTLIKMTAIEPAIDIDHILKELKSIPDSGGLSVSESSTCISSGSSFPGILKNESAPFDTSSTETLLDSMESTAPIVVADSHDKVIKEDTGEEPYKATAAEVKEQKKDIKKTLSMMQIFEKLLKDLKNHNAVLHSAVVSAKPQKADDKIFEITASDENVFIKKAFEKKENLAFIQDSLSKIIGKKVQFKVIYKSSGRKNDIKTPVENKNNNLPQNENDESNEYETYGNGNGEYEQEKDMSEVHEERKISMPEVSEEDIKKIYAKYYKDQYSYKEAIEDHKDFKEKVDLVSEFFNAKPTHFNDKQIKK